MYDIVMCGIPRSGSTLVWQILQAIFPQQKIPKTHPDLWEPDGSVIVASIRDPRDVCASLLRVRLAREYVIRNVVDDDIVTVIRRTKLSFHNLGEMLVGPHLPLLRYEQFYNNHGIIYDMIEEYMDVEIPENIRYQISGKFSTEMNRKRASVLESFNQVDKDQIHGDHIGHVTPGYWKEYIPERYLKQIDEACKTIGNGWGYEDQ